MKLTIIGRKSTIGQNKTFKMKGLSRTEYPFEYDAEHKRYVYEAKSQKEVEDIFYASIKLYRSLNFMPIFEEKKTKKPRKTKASKVEEMVS